MEMRGNTLSKKQEIISTEFQYCKKPGALELRLVSYIGEQKTAFRLCLFCKSILELEGMGPPTPLLFSFSGEFAAK
jgi:hypothetical protein